MIEVCVTLSVYLVADDEADAERVSENLRAACENVENVSSAFIEATEITDRQGD